MKTHISQIIFVTAFGAAIAASAQSPEGGTAPVVPDPNPAIMPSGGDNARPQAPPQQDGIPTTQRDKVEANGQAAPARACADLPEADVDACFAREDAAKTSGDAASKASTSSSGKTSSDAGTGSSATRTTNGSAATQK
jgi:hypothetical protein